MATAGDISINLVLENGQFTAQVQNSGRLLQALDRNLNRAADSAHKTERHFNSLSGHFRSFMMTVAATRFALLDIDQVFLSMPRQIIKASGEIERMTKLMEGLSKETDQLKRRQEAAQGVKYVFNLAQNAPFEVKALTDAFVKLKTAGLDPTKGSLDTLVNSVSRFGGSSEHLHRASIAIQQMTGKGVISMEELRQQLGEAVPTAMQSMATGVGLSMGELVNKISKGTVEARSALERMFAVMRVENDGAALAMMETYVGQLEKLKTNWTLFLAETGNSGGFLKEVKNQLEALNGAFSTQEVRTFAHTLSVGLRDAIAFVGDAFRSIKNNADSLIFAGKAVLAIWGTSKLVSIFRAMHDSWKDFHKTYVLGVQEIIAGERLKRQTELAGLAAAAAKSKETAEIVANIRAQLAQMATTRAAIVVQLNAANATNIAAKAAGAHSFALQQAALSAKAKSLALAQLATIERATTAVEAQLAAAAAASAAAHTAAGVAASAAAVKLGALAVAKRTVGAAVTLLGGPIGVITTLLAAGALAWMNWGNKAKEAAKEAADAVARVRDGYATLEDVQTLSATAEAKGRQIKNQKIKMGTDKYASDPTVLARMQRELDVMEGEYQELLGNVRKAIEQGNEVAIQGNVRAVESQTQRLIDANKAASHRLIDAQLQEADKRFKAGEITEKNFQEKRSDLTRQLAVAYANAEIAQFEAQADVIRNEMKRIEGEKDSVQYKSYERQLQLVVERADNARVALASAKKIGTMSTLIDGGAGQNSKAEQDGRLAWLKQVEDKLVSLNAELNKKGSGDIAKLLESDVDQIKVNGKPLSAAEKEKLRSEWGPKLISADDDLRLTREFEQTLQGITNKMDEVDVALDGGVDGLERWRNVLNRIMNETKNDKLLAEVQDALDQIDLLGKKKSAMGLRDITNDLTGQIDNLRASLTPESRDNIYAAYAKDVDSLRLKIEKLSLTEADRDKANAIFATYQSLRWQKMQQDMETPLQKMMRNWDDTTSAMNNATAQWADSFVDTIATMVKTGKLQWKSFVVQVLDDLLKIIIRKQIAGLLGSLVASSAGSGTDSLGIPTDMGAVDANFVPAFANGGIMTSMGSLPLHKYAMGGIANSPQLALFGEGRMPEAYVPLPDGRSIPVSFKGGAGGGDNIAINIVINNNGDSSSDSKQSQQGSSEMAQLLGQKIKSVVMETLVDQKRPGGVLYRG